MKDKQYPMSFDLKDDWTWSLSWLVDEKIGPLAREMVTNGSHTVEDAKAKLLRAVEIAIRELKTEIEQ